MGGKVESVTLAERDCPDCPNGKSLGGVLYSSRLETRADAFKELIVRYAGGLAVQKAYPRCTDNAGSDEQKADALLARFFPDAPGRAQVKARARALAAEIVAEEWPRIERLALALRNWGLMSGQKVAALFAVSSRDSLENHK